MNSSKFLRTTRKKKENRNKFFHSEIFLFTTKYILIEIIILYFCVQLWLCEFQIFLPLIAVVFP